MALFLLLVDNPLYPFLKKKKLIKRNSYNIIKHCLLIFSVDFSLRGEKRKNHLIRETKTWAGNERWSSKLKFGMRLVWRALDLGQVICLLRFRKGLVLRQPH